MLKFMFLGENYEILSTEIILSEDIGGENISTVYLKVQIFYGYNYGQHLHSEL